MSYKPTAYELRKEKEADYFARCLLMPDFMMQKEVDLIRNSGKHIHTSEAIKMLSKTFQVEQHHVVLRLHELKLMY